jgi:hypothetical protein
LIAVATRLFFGVGSDRAGVFGALFENAVLMIQGSINLRLAADLDTNSDRRQATEKFSAH